MANGSIKAVEDVRQGDRLMGPDGRPRNVLSIASGAEMLYKVSPKKGDPYIVNESHILSLRKTPGSDGLILADGRRVMRDDDIVNVNVRVFSESNATARHCLKGWRADVIDEFETEFSDDERVVPAYILGAWIGDGTVGRAAITKPPCAMVDAWIEYGKSVGISCVRDGSEGACPSWRLTNGKNGGAPNVAIEALRAAGVCNDKHIPGAYLYAPASERLQLLAGLIDSDGHVSRAGCDWITSSERLASQFAFLCRSLGFACYISKQTKGIRSSGFSSEYWRASVSGDLHLIPTRDKRFPVRCQKKRHLVHGVDVRPIGVGEYFGFEIDGDRLFLLGDFTVTHNTYLGLRIIHEALRKGKRAVFVCDRTTLINQTSAAADRYGLSAHGVIQSQHWRFSPDMPFQIASAQTLARRTWPDADVIVIDEAHTQLAAWTEHIPHCRAAVIGLSATPFSKGLGRLFSNLVNATTMAELTESGVLVPMRVFSCTRPDMAGAETAGGEWTEKAAEQRGMKIIGDVVSEWVKFGENRKTIVFGATIAHCEALCRQFNDAGVMAAMFTAETTPAEREQLLSEYRKPDSVLRVLISVEALAKGFDVPDVGCVVDCRPLRKSLSTAIQMWGRGLRSSPETGKTDCILLDHSGNIIRFAEDFERIFHEGLDALDSGEKLDKAIRRDEDAEKEPQDCPSCGFKPFRKRCIACGHERVRLSLVDHEPGEMVEVMIGKKKLADDRRHLWEQVVTYARSHSAPDRQKGRAANLYKDIVGTWPPRAWSFEATPNVPITRNVANLIRSKNIAFAKATQKALAA
jgi:superfamily II DNA or RNA helicase